MKHKKNFLILLIGAFLLTTSAYLIDNDKAYSKLLHNVIEFVLITSILFGFSAIIYLIVLFFSRLFAENSEL